MPNEHGLRHAGYDHLILAYYRECRCRWRIYGSNHHVTVEPFNEHIDEAIGENGRAFIRWAEKTVNQPLFAAALQATLRGVVLNWGKEQG